MPSLLIIAFAVFVNGADPTDTQTAFVEVPSLQKCADVLNRNHVVEADGATYYMTHGYCRVAEVDAQGNVGKVSPLPEGE